MSLTSQWENKIVEGDAVAVLQQLPDRCVDLVILDPPYWKVVNQTWDFQWRTEQDYVEWCQGWLREVARVTKRSGSLYLFGYLRNLVHLFEDVVRLGFDFRQQIVIEKGLKSLGGRKTSTYKMFPNVTESILFFIADSKPIVRELLRGRQKTLGLSAKEINRRLGVKTNGGGVWSLYTGDNILAQVPTREMWDKLQEVLDFQLPYEEIAQTFNIEMGITDVWSDIDFYAEKRVHPTQKPADLIQRLVYASSNEGMLVLDPFMGSGTTAVVCQKMGRRYIGIENDPTYVKLAKERLDSHTSHETA